MSGTVTGRVFLLGTDSQGRDVFSAILYGSRVSLLVGFSSVLLSVVLGVSLGLISGYIGGRTDALIMRVADIQLSFPAILIALLVFGVARGLIAPRYHERRRDRGADRRDRPVQLGRLRTHGARLDAGREEQGLRDVGARDGALGLRHHGRRHVLPNVIGPVLVIATINLALAIIAGADPLVPRRRRAADPALARHPHPRRQQFLFSGEWWILLYPALDLVLLALSINLLGDWLRDALNPKLR